MKKYGKPPCLFKISITASQYAALIKQYREDQIHRMYYIYFDTSHQINEAQLLKKKMRLRVRVKDKKLSLELKIYGVNNQEFKQEISDNDLAELFQGRLPDGEIKKFLEEFEGLILNIKTAHTTRAKKDFSGGVLVLDKTVCRGVTHFQVEFRSYINQPGVISEFKRKFKLIKKTTIITKLMFMWCV
jgi:uncharacterized protein YjbK